MRGSAIAMLVIAALAAATGVQAQTRLMTYEGVWGDAIEAALPAEAGTPAVSILRYEGSLAALNKDDADLLDAETDAADIICDQGPALPVPPVFWKQTEAETHLLPGTAHDCGTGYLVTSLLLASAGAGPRDWAGFFDGEAFSGTRALPRGARGTLEIALMGDGVPVGDVYALLATEAGTTQAFDALDKLAAQTQIIFWDRPADLAALMGSGSVEAAAMPNVQAALMSQDRAAAEHVSLHFHGQVYRIQRLLLLAGTAGQADALAVMQRVLSPRTQAALALSLMAGPVNLDAYRQLPKDHAALLPTAPAHRISDTGLEEDADFWAEHGPRLTERFHDWLAAYEGRERQGAQ